MKQGKNQMDFEIMKQRDNKLSRFYMREHDGNLIIPKIQWKTITIISNWDNFSYMIEHMLQIMGWNAQVFENTWIDINIPDSDLVILWPWYGDINNEDDSKMTQLLATTKQLHEQNQNMLWVCLGHQALCKNLWFQVERQEQTTQWVQIELERFWKVGMYNSFSPKWNTDILDDSLLDSDERILYQKTWNTISSQFHPESIMTQNGFEILKEMVLEVI